MEEHSKKSLPLVVLCSIWLIVVIIHLISFVFLFINAEIHYKLQRSGGPNILGVQLNGLAAFLFILLGCLHLRAALALITCRKLTHHSSSKDWASKTSRFALIRGYYKFRHWHSTYFGPNGTFGRNGQYYEIRLAIREMVEIPSQSYQAWTMSKNLANSHNAFAYTCLIVVNCITSPLLLSSRSFTIRRIFSVLLDGVFDFIFGAVFPLFLLSDSVNEFMLKGNRFKTMDNTWLINTHMILRQVAVSSVPDLITKIIPFIFSYSMLRNLMKSLFDQRRDIVKPFKSSAKCSTSNADLKRRNRKILTRTFAIGSFTAICSKKEIVPFHKREFSNPMISAVPYEKSPERIKIAKRFNTIAIVLSVLWSGALIAFSMTSLNNDACPRECVSDTAEWLSVECTCWSYFLDCEIDAISDEKTLHENLLNISTNIESLTLRRCVLPTGIHSDVIRRLDNLVYLRIEHSQMKEWNISQDAFSKRMMSIDLRNSNLTEIPGHLIDFQKMPMFRQLEISDAFLVDGSIPADLGEKWKGLREVRLQGNFLEKWPFSSLVAPSFPDLFLERNRLKEIPEQIFRDMPSQRIFVAGNLIHKIPESLADSTLLFGLYASGNPITDIPASLAPSIKSLNAFSIADTPVCEAFNNGSASSNLRATIESLGTVFQDLCRPSCSKDCPAYMLENYVCDETCEVESCGYDLDDCSVR